MDDELILCQCCGKPGEKRVLPIVVIGGPPLIRFPKVCDSCLADIERDFRGCAAVYNEIIRRSPAAEIDQQFEDVNNDQDNFIEPSQSPGPSPSS